MGILSDNFRVYNCRERLELPSGDVGFVVPMVSFCDIPLSEVKSHIAKYGSYGLGLTKEWGIKNGLNPVLYMERLSKLSGNFENAFAHFVNPQENGHWTSEQKCFVDLIRYMKNYEGDLIRKGTTTKRYRFSDEREWRFVPSVDTDCEMICGQGDYERDAVFRKETDAKLERLRLTFEPNDIKYIIIQNDSEIGDFIEHLRRAKGNKYVHADVERLTTRILTSEQIHQDM